MIDPVPAGSIETAADVRRRSMRRLSLALLIGVHLACLLVIAYPPTIALLVLALGSYLVRMWGITVGFHRCLTHRAFRTSRLVQFGLAFLGTAAMQNGPIWWASWHRRHHRYADAEGDPHSPRVSGFWRAHLGWVFDGEHDEQDNTAADLVAFPELRWLERHKWVPLVAWAAACFALAGVAGVVWGFFVSTIAVNHATFLINSLGHVWGSRRYDTRDRSRNNALLALLTLGEGWHNNHHRYLRSARQGETWWELDPSYWSIALLRRLGLVWDVRLAPRTG